LLRGSRRGRPGASVYLEMMPAEGSESSVFGPAKPKEKKKKKNRKKGRTAEKQPPTILRRTPATIPGRGRARATGTLQNAGRTVSTGRPLLGDTEGICVRRKERGRAWRHGRGGDEVCGKGNCDGAEAERIMMWVNNKHAKAALCARTGARARVRRKRKCRARRSSNGREGVANVPLLLRVESRLRERGIARRLTGRKKAG